jgi:ankyrin repeat protein
MALELPIDVWIYGILQVLTPENYLGFFHSCRKARSLVQQYLKALGFLENNERIFKLVFKKEKIGTKFQSAIIFGNLRFCKYLKTYLIVDQDEFQTFLYAAVEESNIDIIKFLISQKANIHADKDEVICHINGNVEIVKFLVSQKVDVKAHYNYALTLSASQGWLEIVEFLVSQGVDIHSRGDILLYNASLSNFFGIVKFLVSHGVNVHGRNDDVLRNACIRGNLEMVKYLVSQGANIHADNDSAIYSAIIGSSLEIVKYLITQGINIYHIYDESIDTAKYCECKDIIEFLESIHDLHKK